MFGTGETLISTKDGKPVFSGESDRVYGVFEKIAKIFGTDGVCLDRDKIGASDTDAKPFARTAFRTGHFMFMSETLGCATLTATSACFRSRNMTRIRRATTR